MILLSINSLVPNFFFFTVEYHIVVFHNLYMPTFPDTHTANSRTVGTELCLCYSSELARGTHLNTGSHPAFQDGLKLVAICLLHAGVTGICTHAQILVQLVLQSESLGPSSSKVTSLHWVLNTNWVKRFSLWQNREQNSDSACSPKPFKPRGTVEKTRGSRRLASQAEQSQWPQLQTGGHSKPASQA